MTSLGVGRALARLVYDNFCAKAIWGRFCQGLGDKMAGCGGQWAVFSVQCSVYSKQSQSQSQSLSLSQSQSQSQSQLQSQSQSQSQ